MDKQQSDKQHKNKFGQRRYHAICGRVKGESAAGEDRSEYAAGNLVKFSAVYFFN